MGCRACGSAVPGTARFCPSCGIVVDFSAAATLDPEAIPRAPGSPGASPHKRCSSPSGRIPSSSDSFDGARFIPGSIRCSDRNGVASRCRSHHLTTSRKCRSDIHRVSSGLLLAINLSPNIGPKLFHDNRNRVVLDLRAPYACGIR